jgi:hypothetical protein
MRNDRALRWRCFLLLRRRLQAGRERYAASKHQDDNQEKNHFAHEISLSAYLTAAAYTTSKSCRSGPTFILMK